MASESFRTASGKVIGLGTLGYHVGRLLLKTHPEIFQELGEEVLLSYKASPRGSSKSRRVKVFRKIMNNEELRTEITPILLAAKEIPDEPVELDDCEDDD